MKHILSILIITIIIVGCSKQSDASKSTPSIDEKENTFAKDLPVDAIDVGSVDIDSMWLFQIQDKYNGKTCYSLIDILEIHKSKNGYILYGKKALGFTREVIFKIKVNSRSDFELPSRDSAELLRVAISETSIVGIGIIREEPQITDGDEGADPEVHQAIRSGVCFIGNLVKIETRK